MTERGEGERAHHGTVGVDIALVEADAGKKSLQRCIAMPQKSFPVKPTPHLVDFRCLEGMCVRERKCVVLAVIICQPKPSEGADHRVRRVNLRRDVIYAVKVILLGKIVVDSEGSQILSRASRE